MPYASAVPAQQIAAPQADLSTSGAGWVDTELPAGVLAVDLLLDEDAYVVLDRSSDDPGNDGVPYKVNLDFRLHCRGCTHVHLKRAGGTDATMQWTAWRMP